MNEEIKRQIFKEWLEGSPKRDLCWRYQIEPKRLDQVIEQMKVMWDKKVVRGYPAEKK